jgi:acid phosphatase class B
MELYPERIVFITGRIRNVVMAQSEITAKQYSMRLHETVNFISCRRNVLILASLPL